MVGIIFNSDSVQIQEDIDPICSFSVHFKEIYSGSVQNRPFYSDFIQILFRIDEKLDHI